LLLLHDAEAPFEFEPETVAEEQRTLTAAVGMAVQGDGKLLELAPTLIVQLPPLLLLFSVNAIVALELPGI
jgi:hypothetical protein